MLSSSQLHIICFGLSFSGYVLILLAAHELMCGGCAGVTKAPALVWWAVNQMGYGCVLPAVKAACTHAAAPGPHAAAGLLSVCDMLTLVSFAAVALPAVLQQQGGACSSFAHGNTALNPLQLMLCRMLHHERCACVATRSLLESAVTGEQRQRYICAGAVLQECC